MALIGLGLGPLIFGIMSDWLNARGLGAAEGLRYSLLLASVPAAVIAIGCYLMASRGVVARMAEQAEAER